ncbi:MAG: LamG domain-containing protein [Opitutae bacterium]|nr:LamG domain-containing protein [Opitutae bacterium]
MTFNQAVNAPNTSQTGYVAPAGMGGAAGGNAGKPGQLLITLSHVTVPVSRWQAEGNGNDSVGSNQGTLVNGVGFVTGRVGQAFSLDGYDDHVEIPDNVSVDRPSVTNALTLCAWVKWDGVAKPDLCPVLYKSIGYGATTNPWNTYQLAITNAGSVYVSLSNGVANGEKADVWSIATLTVGTWYHIAATYDGTNIKAYIDGLLVGTWPVNVHIGNREGPLFIGTNTEYAGGNHFGGQIDEPALYDQALPIAEIREIAGL